MKRKQADVWFSKCIRERADWKCEYSGKDFSANKGALHCSHFYGRRARSVRWDADNAFAHGSYEHKYLGENPGEFHAWAIKTRGEGWYEMLTEKWRNVKMKITKKEEKLIAKHYKEQYAMMQQKRDAGHIGWLEFDSYF